MVPALAEEPQQGSPKESADTPFFVKGFAGAAGVADGPCFFVSGRKFPKWI